MTKEEFQAALVKYAATIEKIRQSAHELHRSVNQLYGKNLPYSDHLDKVVDEVREYGHEVCASEEDVVPMIFGGYYHDSIEDARLTYNDVMKVARQFMNDKQALMATEIVYALTNDKGRNREERAGEKYYEGIRTTPYAPFTKLCDRVANITFSCSATDEGNKHMKEVYKKEVPHFLAAINPHSDDPRFGVPMDLVIKISEQIINDMEREEWLNGLG